MVQSQTRAARRREAKAEGPELFRVPKYEPERIFTQREGDVVDDLLPGEFFTRARLSLKGDQQLQQYIERYPAMRIIGRPNDSPGKKIVAGAIFSNDIKPLIGLTRFMFREEFTEEMVLRCDGDVLAREVDLLLRREDRVWLEELVGKSAAAAALTVREAEAAILPAMQAQIKTAVTNAVSTARTGETRSQAQTTLSS